jgi:hypothetical protein
MTTPEDQGMVSDIGPIEIDWPRTVGYYGGIGAALAVGMIEWPVALFIGAVPFFKMLTRPGASYPERMIGQVLDGASRPVGGDSEASIRLTGQEGTAGPKGRRAALPGRAMQGPKRIWDEARLLANHSD